MSGMMEKTYGYDGHQDCVGKGESFDVCDEWFDEATGQRSLPKRYRKYVRPVMKFSRMTGWRSDRRCEPSLYTTTESSDIPPS
jgi:hypothetical protein